MALNFISNTSLAVCKTEIYNLFLRIIAGLLLGNLEMHLKNFAMFNQNNAFRHSLSTPSYEPSSSIHLSDFTEKKIKQSAALF